MVYGPPELALATQMYKTLALLHLHLVILQTLLSKATYNWGIHKAIHLKEANKQEVLARY